MPEPTPLNAPQEPPEPDTDAEKPKDEEEDEWNCIISILNQTII